jgi:hypothetical protein
VNRRPQTLAVAADEVIESVNYFRCWPTASNVAVQANVGLLVNCGSGSRVLEASK